VGDQELDEILKELDKIKADQDKKLARLPVESVHTLSPENHDKFSN